MSRFDCRNFRPKLHCSWYHAFVQFRQNRSIWHPYDPLWSEGEDNPFAFLMQQSVHLDLYYGISKCCAGILHRFAFSAEVQNFKYQAEDISHAQKMINYWEIHRCWIIDVSIFPWFEVKLLSSECTWWGPQSDELTQDKRVSTPLGLKKNVREHLQSQQQPRIQPCDRR